LLLLVLRWPESIPVGNGGGQLIILLKQRK
jgi:hypothetical protein